MKYRFFYPVEGENPVVYFKNLESGKFLRVDSGRRSSQWLSYFQHADGLIFFWYTPEEFEEFFIFWGEDICLEKIKMFATDSPDLAVKIVDRIEEGAEKYREFKGDGIMFATDLANCFTGVMDGQPDKVGLDEISDEYFLEIVDFSQRLGFYLYPDSQYDGEVKNLRYYRMSNILMEFRGVVRRVEAQMILTGAELVRWTNLRMPG